MSQYSRVGRCPIDVYVASNMTYDYPYKLIKPEHANSNVAQSCESLIMDSGIGDEISNHEVLELANKFDADMVVAKDYLHDTAKTTQSIHEFADLWNDSECRATPLIPLQPPHHEHWNELDIDAYHVMLGGMAFDHSASEIITAVQKFRETAGMGPYVHLLGVGANPRVMDYLANNPDMVQSLDCSTPEQCAINGTIYDVELTQETYKIRTGEGSYATRSGLAQHLAYTLADAITMRFENQTPTLDQWT